MKIIDKIIEYFYPFTDNPEDFVLKNTATWYSGIYRYILYSGNKGKTFKYLLHASPPLFEHGDTILEYNWSYEQETFSCERTKFSDYKDKFKSIKDIQEYHEKQYQRFLDGRKDIKERRKRYLERLNENIK